MSKNLPLHDWHTANKAKFADVAGFAVPAAYNKVEIEYGVLRNSAGYTDLCHLGRVRVEGADAEAFLDDLLTISAKGILPHRARYGFLCNSRGGVIDAVTVYREENFFLIFVHADRRQRVIDWMEEQRTRLAFQKVQIIDATTSNRQVAILGPQAEKLYHQLFPHGAPKLEPGEGHGLTMGTARVLAVRRNPRGLNGYDLITGGVFLSDLWQRLTDAARAVGARPVGTAAIDIVRVENGLPTVGSEMDEDTTPLEADQSAYVDFHKKRFSGRRAMMHSTTSEFSRMLTSLRIDSLEPPRRGSSILFDGMMIGRVTSAVTSPALGCAVALGFVNSVKAVPGTQLMVQSMDATTVMMAETIRPGQLVRR